VLGAAMACFWKVETGREVCSRAAACREGTERTRLVMRCYKDKKLYRTGAYIIP
jgi:hypothetical protein